MSLLPFLFDDAYAWPNVSRPSRIHNQHFGLALDPEDLLQPLSIPKVRVRYPGGYLRHWAPAASQQDAGSTITNDKEKFQANLDVQQFKPEEITVKMTGENTITIEGKHDEKQDEHGHIYRHFVRKYVLPKNCDMARIESKLSSDGVLSITAPKIEDNPVDHKTIPIMQTGEPVKAVEKKSEKTAES